jgi:DNA polymerase (family 10)
MTNSEISDILALFAKLMDIHGENSFKIKTYSNASFQIDRLPQQLIDLPKEHIASIRGIGDSVAKNVLELIETGKLSQLEELIVKTPEGILELMKIKGIGPKKIATIWHELGIESPGELLYACNENRLIHYKGFGEKTQLSIKEALEFYFSNQQRYLYAQLEPIAHLIEQRLQRLFSHCRVQITGDFVRQCDIINELSFVISTNDEEIIETLAHEVEFKFDLNDNGVLKFLFNNSIHLELHACDEYTFTETVFFTTNSPAFNDAFQEHFPEVEFEGNESEEDLFAQAGIEIIEPCLRESAEIIELAKDNTIPALIQTKDIRGIIHNHSTWSDGAYSIEEMARACIQKGYEYLVMSDHSVTSFYANGLSVERILLQHEEIDRLNEQLKPFKIFKSIECDILGEGQLDYNDNVLSTFDLVITSIHQNLKMTQEKAMTRLLRAVEHPSTRILGHPTGRLLLSRKEYPVDFEQLIEACAKHDVVIEINANPRRLDLDWRWIQSAMKKNVMLSINPDAHSIVGIDDVRYGVLSAQKGMLTKDKNLSSMSLNEFEEFLKKKK